MNVDFFSFQSQPLRGITHDLNPILYRVFLISYEFNHPIELTCLSYSPHFAQKKKKILLPLPNPILGHPILPKPSILKS